MKSASWHVSLAGSRQMGRLGDGSDHLHPRGRSSESQQAGGSSLGPGHTKWLA